MANPVKKSILVLPDSSFEGVVEWPHDPYLAKLSGKLSYLVDLNTGLTPAQLKQVVQQLDKYLGIDQEAQ